MLSWYVIQTKPKKEKLAALNIKRESIEVFFPKIEAISMVFGKPKKVLRPLFPNYIFACFDPMVSYRLITWSKGVTKVIGFGGRPSPLNKEVIGIIKRRVDDDCVVQKALHFKAKDLIRIRSGPFRDLKGVFERWVSDEGRVCILLNLLNSDAKLEIHYSQVEKFPPGNISGQIRS